MDPIPRQELFDAYWHLAAERQAIFFRRLRGDAPPWSDDLILREYKFCNAYRASDRHSQFLIHDVIYQTGLDATDTYLRIVLFRLFNRISTWQMLERANGPVTRCTFDPQRYGQTLDAAFSRGEPIYTNAYLLCASDAFGYRRKHRNHLALIELMLRDDLPVRVCQANSLRDIYELLIPYPLIGPFTAYQLAIDLNYSEIIDFNENDFTMPGPGALRGIDKCFVDLGALSKQEVIRWMVDRQSFEFDRLDLRFESLFGRSLHAIDCQNLFCELDKYARVAFPELSSNRRRIKSKFKPTAAAFKLFYPPKWGLNERIALRLIASRPNLEQRGWSESST